MHCYIDVYSKKKKKKKKSRSDCFLSDQFLVSIGVCEAFFQRRASKNCSKGQEGTIHGGSCNCQPFLYFFHFARLPRQTGSKVFLIIIIDRAVYWACAGKIIWCLAHTVIF